jgi:hypothetical protein
MANFFFYCFFWGCPSLVWRGLEWLWGEIQSCPSMIMYLFRVYPIWGWGLNLFWFHWHVLWVRCRIYDICCSSDVCWGGINGCRMMGRLGKKWFHFKAIQSDFSLKWWKARVIAILTTATFTFTLTFAYFSLDNFSFHLSLFSLMITVTFTSTFHFVQWRLAALLLPTSTWLVSRHLCFAKTHQKIATLNLPFCSTFDVNCSLRWHVFIKPVYVRLDKRNLNPWWHKKTVKRSWHGIIRALIIFYCWLFTSTLTLSSICMDHFHFHLSLCPVANRITFTCHFSLYL